jgi:DNA-binding NarL/FixJ family response regulator
MKISSVYILDDHQIVVEGVRLMLENVPDIEIVGTQTSPEMALEELKILKPDILISDITMPGMSGIELSKHLSKQLPSVSILILTMIDSTTALNDLLESGIKGYILKNKGRDELIGGIRAIAQGQNYFSPEIMKQILTAARNIDKPQQLTIREIEIIKCLASGLNSSEIAGKLFISENTVETHRRNILRKTNTHSTIELINYSRANHVIGS